MKGKFLFFVFILTCTSAFAQTTIVLQPDSATGKDAMLHGLSSVTNNNFGSDTQFPAEAWTFSGVFAVLRGLIQFDFSSIPQNATITSAYLSLYANDASSGLGPHSTVGNVSNNAWLERVITPWNENTVTWNNQPASSTINRVPVSASTSFSEDYLNIDVTTLIQDIFASPSGNNGILLKLDIEQSFRRLNFCTSDYPDSSKHPKLEITYSIPSTISTVDNSDFTVSISKDNTELFLFTDKIKSTCAYTIVDLSGRKVCAGKVNENGMDATQEINITSLCKGLYVLSVNANGTYYHTKFLKSK